jgi:hypothetical protein
VTECDSILSVNIKCTKTTYSEFNKKFNNVNKEDNRDDILEIDLDLEELCELRCMAVRPHVKEVMNDLIMKLTHEARMMKNNSERLKVARPKWSEIVAGTKNRDGDLIHNIIHSISTTNAMQIGKVQSIPNTKENFELRNQTPTVILTTLKTTKRKAKPKHKIVLIGDSHARGCASKLREKPKEEYEVIGYVVPGVGATVLTKTAQQEISGLTEEDTLIYCGGTNDIAKNNTLRGIKLIHHYLLKNQHTNIIFVGAPHRHDLMESCHYN